MGHCHSGCRVQREAGRAIRVTQARRRLRRAVLQLLQPDLRARERWVSERRPWEGGKMDALRLTCKSIAAFPAAPGAAKPRCICDRLSGEPIRPIAYHLIGTALRASERRRTSDQESR